MDHASLRRKAHATVSSLTTASAELTHRVLNLPQVYESYVASNSQAVSQVESALRSLTYFVPGARFHDSELASESLNTFIQILSIYHDHVLNRRAQSELSSPKTSKTSKIPKGAVETSTKPKTTHHARYTSFWTESSPTYVKIATILKISQYTELLWEMIARRSGGERSRWRAVIFLESFKAICRLILLRLTKSRPLVSPPLPLREDFAPTPTQQAEDALKDEPEMREGSIFDARDALGDAGVPTPPLSESEKIPISNAHDSYRMPRTGFVMPVLPNPDTLSSYLLEHVVTPDDVKPVQQLIHRLTSVQGQAAEVLYILRPVIYAVLMQRVARRYGYEGSKWKKNWTPWLAGVAVEYFARQLTKRSLTSQIPGGARSGLSALEREEFTKRGWNIAWWTMRGAFYEHVTKTWIHKAAAPLRNKPILDLVGGVMEDYEFLWSNYHFSTATM